AALLPPNVISAMRRTVSSWRWPFLTRLRALGRYLNEISLGPRVWVTTSALTEASVTSGRPIVDSSPSATNRTRSMVTVLPGSTSRSSTSSSVPTSTRYCLPPVSMTAYMDPQGCVSGDRARRSRHRTVERARGDAERRTRIVRLQARSGQSGRPFPSIGLITQDHAFPHQHLDDERAPERIAERGDDFLRPSGPQDGIEARPDP